MNTRTSNTFSTIGRSLHVFLLATIGLVFYLASFALLLLVCGLIVSACVRAEVPASESSQSMIVSRDAAALLVPDGQAALAGADTIFECVESPRYGRDSAKAQ